MITESSQMFIIHLRACNTHTHNNCTDIYKSTHSSYQWWKFHIGDKLQNRCWHLYVNTNQGKPVPASTHMILCSSAVRYTLSKTKRLRGKRKGGQCQSTLLPREGGGGRSRRWSEDSKEGERSAAQECVCVYAILTIVHCVCVYMCVHFIS